MSIATATRPTTKSQLDIREMWNKLESMERYLTDLVDQANAEWLRLANGNDVDFESVDQAALASIGALAATALPEIMNSIDRTHGLLVGEIQ